MTAVEIISNGLIDVLQEAEDKDVLASVVENLKEYIKFFEKEAKEKEKQQIIDAWEDGQDSFSTRNAKQYYNETFKKNLNKKQFKNK